MLQAFLSFGLQSTALLSRRCPVASQEATWEALFFLAHKKEKGSPGSDTDNQQVVRLLHKVQSDSRENYLPDKVLKIE